MAVPYQWNGNVENLKKLSSLTALEVVKMTILSFDNDENFIKIDGIYVSAYIPYLNIMIIKYISLWHYSEFTSPPWILKSSTIWLFVQYATKANVLCEGNPSFVTGGFSGLLPAPIFSTVNFDESHTYKNKQTINCHIVTATVSLVLIPPEAIACSGAAIEAFLTAFYGHSHRIMAWRENLLTASKHIFTCLYLSFYYAYCLYLRCAFRWW